jgi:rhodanese-related sulfurtransferase
MKSDRFALAAFAAGVLAIALAGANCGARQAASTGPTDLNAALRSFLGSLPEDFGVVTPAALRERMRTSKPLIVDVREVKQVEETGHIDGAINIPLRSLMKNLDKLPAKDRPIVVSCASGHRSALGMEALRLAGYADVRSLAGGFNAWKAAGLPVVPGAPAPANAGTAPEVDRGLQASLDAYLGSLPEGFNTIAPAILKDLIAVSKPFQIDLREPGEIAETGSVPGSTAIPLRTLLAGLDRLPPDRSALVVAECRTGHRSALAMMALGLAGYSNVKSLSGGLTAWTKADLPVSR